MGITPKYGVGKVSIDDERLVAKMKEKWNVDEVPTNVNENMISLLENGMFKNLFIFGEDPVGCAVNKEKVGQWLSIADFIMVQDYFMTETAQKAHLILPASFPVETGGSYTNSQNVIQKFDCEVESKVEKRNYEQILELLSKFGDTNKNADYVDVMMELISMLPTTDESSYQFIFTEKDNFNRIFDFGCDYLVKYFEDDFNQKFVKNDNN